MKIHISGIAGAKLQFVKYIKDYTGLGLKEAKELVDTLPPSGNKPYIELNLDEDFFPRIKKDLEELGLTVQGNTAQQRRQKLVRAMGLTPRQERLMFLERELESLREEEAVWQNRPPAQKLADYLDGDLTTAERMLSLVEYEVALKMIRLFNARVFKQDALVQEPDMKRLNRDLDDAFDDAFN